MFVMDLICGGYGLCVIYKEERYVYIYLLIVNKFVFIGYVEILKLN